jgi:hypothetical protein
MYGKRVPTSTPLRSCFLALVDHDDSNTSILHQSPPPSFRVRSGGILGCCACWSSTYASFHQLYSSFFSFLFLTHSESETSNSKCGVGSKEAEGNIIWILAHKQALNHRDNLKLNINYDHTYFVVRIHWERMYVYTMASHHRSSSS